MKKITYLSVLAITALTWTSCKEDEEAPRAATKTDMLTAHTWKMSGFTVDPAIPWDDTTVVSDIYAIATCYHDNTIAFSASGGNRTYSENEGADNCIPEDPAVSSGTWNLNAAETMLTLDPEDESPVELEVVTLTESSLKVTMDIQIADYSGTVSVSYDK